MCVRACARVGMCFYSTEVKGDAAIASFVQSVNNDDSGQSMSGNTVQCLLWLVEHHLLEKNHLHHTGAIVNERYDGRVCVLMCPI